MRKTLSKLKKSGEYLLEHLDERKLGVVAAFALRNFIPGLVI